MSAWPRALTSIYFLPSLAPIADGPGRGQHPGSRVGPLITAAQVDVTDASLMAIISPSHFTRPLPQLQISRECLFNRWLIAFYYAATAACVDLPSPSCCKSGGRVPLLVGSWAVQEYSRGCCGSSSLVNARGQCVSPWVLFWGGSGAQHNWNEVWSNQRDGALALPSSRLVSPNLLLSPDLELPILSYPKFPSLR